jgi:transposase-like protein
VRPFRQPSPITDDDPLNTHTLRGRGRCSSRRCGASLVFGAIQAASPFAVPWLDHATVLALELVLIAAAYIGFAVADGRPSVIAVESAVAGLFVVLAATAVTGARGCSCSAAPAKGAWQQRRHYVANPRWWPVLRRRRLARRRHPHRHRCRGGSSPARTDVSVSHANARLTVHGPLELARRVVQNGWPVAHVVAELNCSRATGYKWLRRWREEGPDGLVDRPSAARRLPGKTPVEIEARILELRQARKIGPARIAPWSACRPRPCMPCSPADCDGRPHDLTGRAETVTAIGVIGSRRCRPAEAAGYAPVLLAE